MDQATYDQNETQILGNLTIINNIYVDFEFLKYIDLGKLLSSPRMTKEVFDGIRAIVVDPEFKDRLTDDISIVFESIPSASALYTEVIDKCDDLVMLTAPSFEDSVFHIKRLLDDTEASKTVKGDKTKAKITININSVKDISAHMKRELINDYEGIFGVEVELDDTHITAYGDKILRYDALFISKMSEFNAATITVLDNAKMTNKYLHCRKEIPIAKLPNLSKDDIPVVITSIELVMTAATQFKYLDMSMCLT